MRLRAPNSEDVDTIVNGASCSKDYVTFSIWSLTPTSRRNEITNVDFLPLEEVSHCSRLVVQ